MTKTLRQWMLTMIIGALLTGGCGEDQGSCVEECHPGEFNCGGATGNTLYRCDDFNGDGCHEWGDPQDCPGVCLDGQCANCTNDCMSENLKQCVGSIAFRVCGKFDADPCLEWGSTTDCEPGETCNGGQCVSGCTNDCADGSRRCEESGFQICGEHDDDLCTDWGPVTDCQANETCSNGYCDQVCTNECPQDSLRCDGSDGYLTCGDFDDDPCLEWGTRTPCDDGETCSNGTCSIECEDECVETGARQCIPSGKGHQECNQYDPDTCLEWGPEVSCQPGESCLEGECVELCLCEFYPGICEAAEVGSDEPCTCDPDCAGGAAPCSDDNHCDTWCPAGADPDCDCICDYNEYCEAEINGSTDTCPCDRNCELHEVACSDDAHCDTWCPADTDPDCGEDPCRDRWISAGWRYGDETWLFGSYENPDPDEGAPWIQLSPGTSSGSAEITVTLAAEHLECIDAIRMEVYGYDDSLLGDGAEMFLYNWNTFAFDLLENTVRGSEGYYSSDESGVSPYLLCSVDRCYIDAKLGASSWDQTHVFFMEIFVHLTPN